jgi:hypothetical protein
MGRAPVAQLDRASVYGTEGREFESLLARKNPSGIPHEAQPSDAPLQWMTYVQAMPDIAHRPTLRVRLAVRKPCRCNIVTNAHDGQRVLVCRNDGGASIVVRLHDFGE